MKKYWFKAKRYGWGWYPSTWQGWIVLLLWSAFLIVNFSLIDYNTYSANDALIKVIPQTIALTILLIAICWITGERPRWRWGN